MSTVRPALAASFRTRVSLAAGALIAAASLGAAAPASATPIQPVPSVDLQRYLGDWKQIASIPQWFEVACRRDTTANYQLNANGTVKVTNRCIGAYGLNVVAQGNARVINKTTNAELQVSFVKTGTSWFFPNSQPNYVLIGLGSAYDWAVVADPGRSSTFVLSRAATLTPEQRTAVFATLRSNGIDPCRVRVTPQRGGLQTPVDFCQTQG